MDLIEIVDQLEEAVLSGHKGRLGRGWVVDREQMLDLIDRLRTRTPVSVEQAQQVLEERQQLLRQAHEEAEIVSRRAQEEAEQRLGSHEILLSAQARAAEIIDRANAQAAETAERAQEEAAGLLGRASADAVEQALEADRYSLEILTRLREHLANIDETIGGAAGALRAKVEQTEAQRDLDARGAEGAALAGRETAGGAAAAGQDAPAEPETDAAGEDPDAEPRPAG